MTATTHRQGLDSGNPALSEARIGPWMTEASPDTMSVAGTALKTFVFLVIVVAGGAWGWASATEPVAGDAGQGYANTTVTIPGGFWLASFGALFAGIFAAMNPRAAAPLGAVYALLQGYVLGAISAMFDAQTEGIVGAAIVSTVCVFVAALLLYLTRIIKPTQKMAFGVATGAPRYLEWYMAYSLMVTLIWLYLTLLRLLAFLARAR